MLGTVAVWTVLATVVLGVTALLRDAGVLPGVVWAALLLALAIGATGWLVFKRTRDLRSTVGPAATLALVPLVLLLTASYLSRGEHGELLSSSTLWLRWFVAFVLLALLAWICNANRFSLHWIYKQGLVRTFLGASRAGLRNPTVDAPGSFGDGRGAQGRLRHQETATNIDENDNLALSSLAELPQRRLPVLLFNAAVNGISPTDQEGRVPRQWPFTFSQYHCGSPAAGIGYGATGQFYADEPGHGLSLGGAMAVSGAAVSPTAGQTTQPLRAFLLGMLNARLGMWIGNPRHRSAMSGRDAGGGGVAILRELIGLPAKFGRWIHLSDGGHFENLGVYELVRRGCLRIIAVDASCDPGREFSDLAHTIRRLRVDLGVRIFASGSWQIHPPDEPVVDPAVDGGTSAGWMWFNIDYGPGLPLGRLLYVKPSVHDTRKLPPEVLNYWRGVREFPHESTMNQFFSEQQMEVYRGLGEANMVEVLEAAAAGLGSLITRSA